MVRWSLCEGRLNIEKRKKTIGAWENGRCGQVVVLLEVVLAGWDCSHFKVKYSFITKHPHENHRLLHTKNPSRIPFLTHPHPFSIVSLTILDQFRILSYYPTILVSYYPTI